MTSTSHDSSTDEDLLVAGRAPVRSYGHSPALRGISVGTRRGEVLALPIPRRSADPGELRTA